MDAAIIPALLDSFFMLQPILHQATQTPTGRRSLTDMERFAAFTLSNFSTIVTLSSLAWLLLRSYKVLSTPSSSLIDLLGIEVPAPPALALHGIKADGVVLNWKPGIDHSSATGKSGIKYSLFVNGIFVQELSPLETSICVSDLRPSTNYILRVVAVNSANFEARSEGVHVQTLSTESGDFFKKRDSLDANAGEQEVQDEKDKAPVVRNYKLLSDAAVAAAAVNMSREHSNSISQGNRKSVGGRRVSAAASHGIEEHDEGSETVRELTAKLDKLNQEIEAAREDITKEDEEFHDQQAALNVSKSDLKQAVADKESASKALKKQVADLSGQNSSAQARKVTAEKRLEAKHAERRKMKEEIRRWEEEIVLFQQEAETLAEKKGSIRTEADQELEALRAKLEEANEANKSMEEEVRKARAEVKDLETQREQMHQEGTDEVSMQPPIRQGSYYHDRDWESRLQMLQFNYQRAFHQLDQARAFMEQARSRQAEWEHRRQAEPSMFNFPHSGHGMIDFPPPGPNRRGSNRNSRSMSLRNSELNPQSSPFEMSSPPPYSALPSGNNNATGGTNISPPLPFASMSPFFNMMNGGTMMPSPQHDISGGMTQEQVDQLTGGGPTSPSIAGALLPAGLLGDDDNSRLGSLDSSSSHGSSPLASNALPGLGAPGMNLPQTQNRDPQSPASNPSRSPSVFASPRESSTHLPFAFPPDALFDSDRRSIRSTTSSMRPSATTSTRFAHIFNFNRQRGKTASGESPAIGSLRGSESQSFPRQDLEDFDSTAGRRRGSHSGGSGLTWRDQLQNPFSRSTNKDATTSSGAAESAPKKRFGIFGSKNEPGSPARPHSTASSENRLPFPAVAGSRFGWNSSSSNANATDPFGNVGREWGIAAASSWSQRPSRRPSVHGSTHAFSIDERLPEDSDLDLALPRRRSPKLAPIGTRPASQISTISKEASAAAIAAANMKPSLNPAAPSFRLSLFGKQAKSAESDAASSDSKGKKKDKGKKESLKDKDSRSTSPLPIEPSTPASREDLQDLSPPNEGGRYGAPSISTFDTASEPRTSLERTPSRTSDGFALGGASSQRESFMQKLSRKSSASMFTFPSFTSSKDKTGRLPKQRASSELVEGIPDETDEEGKAGGKLEGLSSAVGPTSAWKEAKEVKEGGKFSFRRSLTGRRKGERAPSIQESETGDEMEGGGEEGSTVA